MTEAQQNQEVQPDTGQDALSRIRAATVGQGKKGLRNRIVHYYPPKVEKVQETDSVTGQSYAVSKVVGHHAPVAVEIRQPSVKERNDLIAKYRQSENMDMDLILWMMVNQTFVPGTEQRVYTKEDYDSLVNSPAGGFVDQFGEVAMELLNVDTDAAGKG